MKTKLIQVTFLAVAAGVILILSACTKDDPLTSDLNSNQAILKTGAGPQAFGMGIYGNNWEGISHFKFHAITMSNGSIQGDGELRHFIGDERYLKYDVDCMTVTGNEIVMGGYVTESTFELIPVDARVFVRVVDNGGGGSDPDQYTGVWYEGCEGWDDDWDCNNFPPQPLISIEQGNFVVIP